MKPTKPVQPVQPVKEAVKQMPETKFRSGSVTATIWAKEIDTEFGKKKLYSVNFERGYKDAQDEWQKSNSFRKQDVSAISVLVRKVEDYLFLDEDEESAEEIA